MVVRYKPDHLPVIPDELNPYDFDWIKHRGSDYRYFFVRNSAEGGVQQTYLNMRANSFQL